MAIGGTFPGALRRASRTDRFGETPGVVAHWSGPGTGAFRPSFPDRPVGRIGSGGEPRFRRRRGRTVPAGR